MSVIHVLMCGGRRIGKTSIMAAIQKNVQDMFPKGDIVLEMENANSLVLYRREQEAIFGPEYEDENRVLAAQNPSLEKSEYSCKVYLKDKKSDIKLCFIDVPGEWFIDRTHESEILELLRNSQILVIAIDSPHLIEKEGRYHEVFNRATILTEKIKKAFQGNTAQRMILFTPLKCERYKNKGRMEELADAVLSGYEELITYLSTPEAKKMYSVAITPVITMGGMEFLRFIKPLDEYGNLVCDRDGNPLEDVSIDEATGYLRMNWLAEYLLLTDSYGDHFYEPCDCEQPLLYSLLFLIGMGKKRNSWGILGDIWNFILQLPSQSTLDACKQDLVAKRKANKQDGYIIVNDPMKMLHE